MAPPFHVLAALETPRELRVAVAGLQRCKVGLQSLFGNQLGSRQSRDLSIHLTRQLPASGTLLTSFLDPQANGPPELICYFLEMDLRLCLLLQNELHGLLHVHALYYTP